SSLPLPFHPPIASSYPPLLPVPRAYLPAGSSRNRSSPGPAVPPNDRPAQIAAGARIPAHRKTTDLAISGAFAKPPAAPESHGNSAAREYTESVMAPPRSPARSLPSPESGTPPRSLSPGWPPATHSSGCGDSSEPASPPAQMPRQVPPPSEAPASGLPLPTLFATPPGSPGLVPAQLSRHASWPTPAVCSPCLSSYNATVAIVVTTLRRAGVSWNSLRGTSHDPASTLGSISAGSRRNPLCRRVWPPYHRRSQRALARIRAKSSPAGRPQNRHQPRRRSAD